MAAGFTIVVAPNITLPDGPVNMARQRPVTVDAEPARPIDTIFRAPTSADLLSMQQTLAFNHRVELTRVFAAISLHRS
jgi:hypothetical protein